MRTIALLRPAPGASFEAIGAILPREEPVLWSYIAAGECRAIHYDAARPGGVVLEFETNTRERARALVAAFPLVAEGFMEAEFLELEPYTGLALMFRPEFGFAPRPPDAWRRAGA